MFTKQVQAMFMLPIKPCLELLGNNVEYCEFPANIILSASEQEERVKVRDKRVQTVQVKDKQGNKHPCRFLLPVIGIYLSFFPLLFITLLRLLE